MTESTREEYRRLLNVIRKIIKTMRSDFASSSENEIVRDRETVYRSFYKVSPIEIVEQDKPITFVDGGFYIAETDVSTLIFMNIGGLVRDEDGRLRNPADLTDHSIVDSFFLYGRWLDKGTGIEYSVRIFPLEEEELLLSESLAEKVSSEITIMVNNGIRERNKLKAIKLFKRLVKYMEGLMEVAYAIKLARYLATDAIIVVDGTLVRWFGVEQIKSFGFEGLDILQVLTRISREHLLRSLLGVYGFVKTTKLTSIARARWLFKNSVLNPTGLYAYTDSESVENAALLINQVIRKKYGDEAAREMTRLFIRIVHPLSGVWVARFPVSTNGSTILHFETHLDKPLLEYSYDLKITKSNPELADKLKDRLKYVIENIMAVRTASMSKLPYGFMETDQYVRIPLNVYYRLEDLFVNIIRNETGEEGHPLEHLFGATRRMRLGYGR